MSTKDDLRKQFLAQRQQLTAEAIGKAAEGFSQQFTTAFPFADFSQQAVVAGYVPVNGELDVMPTLIQLLGIGMTVALPVVEHPDQPLVFRQWTGEPLTMGAYRIPCPSSSAPVVIPTHVLVPLVAFDVQGHRIGYGKGYYDRTLAHLPDHTLSIGCGYSFQCYPQAIPIGPHDKALNWIITNAAVVSVG